MAQTIKRTTATGENRYDVRTRIGGRVVTRTFKRRKDADAYANTTEAKKLRGVAIDPRRAQVTFADYGEKWMESRQDLAQVVGVRLDVVRSKSIDHPIKSGVLSQRRIIHLRDMRFSC